MIKTTVNLLDKYNISVLPVTGAALPDSRFFKKIGFLMKIKQAKAIMKITTPMTNTVLVPPAPGKLITDVTTHKVKKRDF